MPRCRARADAPVSRRLARAAALQSRIVRRVRVDGGAAGGLGALRTGSYAVSQRAREIGLRMAIGATPRDVQRMILRQAAVSA